MISLKDYINESNVNDPNAFVILKPGFIDYFEELKDKLEESKWEILDSCQTKLSLEQAQELYKMHSKKDFYNDLCKYMSSDNCICMKCRKDCKDPIKEMTTIKDKFRDAYAKDDMRNTMHSSDSLENVKRESKIIFN